MYKVCLQYKWWSPDIIICKKKKFCTTYVNVLRSFKTAQTDSCIDLCSPIIKIE